RNPLSHEVLMSRAAAYTPGPISAGGAFTADFALPGSLPLEQMPGLIERDRVVMTKRPGMRQKHLPFRVDTASGKVLSGGRYLFGTFEQAEAYKTWAEREFVVDGVPFFRRPFFLNPVVLAWQVIGAHDFQAIDSGHTCLRFERWAVENESVNARLASAWTALQAGAAQQGCASVWLLHNPEHRQVGLVTVTGQRLPSTGGINQPPADPGESLGTLLEAGGGVRKLFDRTSWVMTIWLPHGDSPETAALWPNSPPLPRP
ncbi:MAG TPA: hypothetical protein VEZ71_27860, partial [Archangium sp.]|nr:hypothetical protein [Archangium sp.]